MGTTIELLLWYEASDLKDERCDKGIKMIMVDGIDDDLDDW